MIFRPILAGGLSDRLKISHSGMIYFYLLLSCTIVFNLWEQQSEQTKDPPPSTSYQFLQWFEFGCMIVSLISMVYINCSTKGRVNFESQDKGLILYFRIGLYVFGVSSLVYAMMNLLDYSNCGNPLNICINAAKFLYIVGQILFLNRFDQAKLPNDRLFIQIALAHILGTNLSLWIWTLCKEVYDKDNSKDNSCRKEPINLGSTEKYFYPLFVEYLLLVASMIYELWANVQTTSRTRGRCNLHYECIYENYHEQTEIEETASENSQQEAVQDRRRISAERRRAKFAPSLALSLILGIAFASVFIAFVLASSDSGQRLREQFIEFTIVNICLYCSQLLACYIALLSCQSQLPNENRGSIDLDDALLYFGLAGILLWEGFHLYGLIFTANITVEKIEYANSVCGMLEDIVQTIILVSIRRCRSRKDNNAKNICSCALFLLATNLAMWFQNSFYIEQNLENPGENHKNLEKNLDIFAHILNPLTIFFRFHSATCCYHMWTIFVTSDDAEA